MKPFDTLTKVIDLRDDMVHDYTYNTPTMIQVMKLRGITILNHAIAHALVNILDTVKGGDRS